jgi:hypothetical protein
MAVVVMLKVFVPLAGAQNGPIERIYCHGMPDGQYVIVVARKGSAADKAHTRHMRPATRPEAPPDIRLAQGRNLHKENYDPQKDCVPTTSSPTPTTSTTGTSPTTATTATSPKTVSPSPAEALKEMDHRLSKFVRSKLAFNAPKEMRFGAAEDIKLTISPSDSVPKLAF